MHIDDYFKYTIVVVFVVLFVFGTVYLILRAKIIVRTAEASSYAAAYLRSIYAGGILDLDNLPSDPQNCRFEVFINGEGNYHGRSEAVKRVLKMNMGSLPVLKEGEMKWEDISVEVYELPPYFCRLRLAHEMGEWVLERCKKECEISVIQQGDLICIYKNNKKWCKNEDLKVRKFYGKGKVFVARRSGNEVVIEA